ncbi:MAG: hypothetical protein WKG01_05665 [Kofleriaceae bacterium]
MGIRWFVALALGVTACGGDGEPEPPTGWQPLITKRWTLAPGTEQTSAIELISIDRDMYLGGMRPISPPGTHHTLMARGASLDSGNIVYASGVGTNELVFPPGKGLKLEAGSLVALQLHVFNTTDAMLAGSSGIEVLEVPASEVVEEVDLFLPGPRDLDIPPMQTSMASGTCTVRGPQTLFALFPHMHQLGTHLKTTVTVGGVPRVIHDADYQFDEQAFLDIEPITLAAGDTITSECTFNNTTGNAVGYGESSTTEMCYSILFRYPAQAEEFCHN